eukprot:TRINITY_DN8772_c0_g2_i1.p1 TRINITY_DN8772_c0_g2~~TRINITY_DN8772_c0_g2_i1.p1  ORF type:complete len:107 (+),score=20.40 TRINITY_DN8772_c0_g2_i1:87-407(+)
MIRRPPRSTLSSSSAASDVYKRQVSTQSTGRSDPHTMNQSRAIVLGFTSITIAAVAASSGYPLYVNYQLGLQDRELEVVKPRPAPNFQKSPRAFTNQRAAQAPTEE